MSDQALDPKDDWEQFQELETDAEAHGAIDHVQWRGFLLRIGPAMYGMPLEVCEAAVATGSGAAALIREMRRRIVDGDNRLTDALQQVKELRERGRRWEAQQVLKGILELESVPIYREVALRQLETLAEMRVIAEHEYSLDLSGPLEPERVTLRIGAPEQDEPGRWGLRFEILGPGRQRVERAVSAGDAVQALQLGLKTIAGELRSLEERNGGRLID